MTDKYRDILNLPHPELHHPRMSRASRAAQFAPFAALTGHDELISETARLTDSEILLDPSRIEELDRSLRLYAEEESGTPVIITHFADDGKKKGGAYVPSVGSIKKIDPVAGLVILDTGDKIPINRIYAIEKKEEKASAD